MADDGDDLPAMADPGVPCNGRPWVPFDYSHLPPSALRHVFERVHGVTPQRASSFYRQFLTLQLVCKRWQEVLLGTPPPLRLMVSALPPDWLSWLPSLPVDGLHVEAGCDPDWEEEPLSPNTGREEQQCDEMREVNNNAAAARLPLGLSAVELLRGLEGVKSLSEEHWFWALAALPRLQDVSLQGDLAPATFDASALQPLTQLSRLRLGAFSDFNLAQLPLSVDLLHLTYDNDRALSVPQLPPGLSLERLRLAKREGAVGLALEDVLACCAAVEVHAPGLLLGVSVHDPQLAATFERPYREGQFVPPHIWGDEDADELSKQVADMAATIFLDVLSASPRLRELGLSGGCSGSLKFMPLLPGRRASLCWLWSVIRQQGLGNLFGLSGGELAARAAGQLPPGMLNVQLVPGRQGSAGTSGSCMLRLREQAVGGSGSGGSDVP